MHIHWNRAYRTKGQAAAALNLIFAIFFIGVAGMASVELSRYMLARDELKQAAEAAALCCQTSLASTGSPTNSSNQQTAQTTALSLFQQNSILGQTLTNASLVTISPGDTQPQFNIGPGESEICFQFLDPLTRRAATGSTAGTLIEATAAYSYVPFFGQFIGLGNTQFTFQTSVLSGIPQLDLVFLYDVSGAQNEQTPVTYIQRYWHDPYGIDYLIPPYINNPPPGITMGGPISPFCKQTPPNTQGPNATTPLALDAGQHCPTPNLIYSENSAKTQLLTSSQGDPPGNYPPPTTAYVVMFGTPYDPTTLNYNGPLYVPVSPNYTGPWPTTYISLSQYYPVSAADLYRSPPSLPITLVPGADPVSIVYLANGTVYTYGPNQGQPIPAVQKPTTTSATGFSSTSNYQASITLQGGTPYTVTFGGGSSYGSTSTTFTPIGPSQPVGPNGGSSVLSFLSGVPYSDFDSVFTDEVVNIDNNTTFAGTTVTYNGNTYPFPSLGSLVEAFHGNLESLVYAQRAGLNLGALGLTQSNLQSGYFAAYMQGALASIQPMNTVANATIAFMNQLSIASDAHFGCITFNDYVGTGPTSTAPPNGTTINNIASNYDNASVNQNPDGSVNSSVNDTYLLPDILLNPAGNTTQSTITSLLPTLHTWGNCGVAGAIQSAVAELTNSSYARPQANKAIILITTQAPDIGLNGDTGTSALSDAITQAQAANAAGIPIYCVSLAQSTSDATNEDSAYNGNSSGIAATAGYNSTYYRVNWSTPSATQTQLTSAFANIARQLVRVVH